VTPIYPKPGELENPECAAFWLTHRAIKAAQIEQGRQMVQDFPSMDYLAVRAWSDRYEKLRDEEKRIRAAIFGFRRRYAPDRARNAHRALSDACEAYASASSPEAGSGAPTPPIPASAEPARPPVRAVPRS
jgi:hypothetical protein